MVANRGIVSMTLLANQSRDIKKGVIVALFAAIFPAVFPFAALSEQITVQVQTDFSPRRFEGLITSTSGVITEKINPAVEEIAPNFYAVTFPIEEKEDKNRMAIAVALDNDGHMAVGPAVPIQSVSASEPCSPEMIDPVVLEVDAGTIRALASNRLKRRDHNRRIFELSLSQFPISDIEKIERKFGLSQTESSKTDVNPFHMVDRISRLLVALDTWDYRKNAIISAPAPEQTEATNEPEKTAEAATAPVTSNAQ